MSNAKAPKHEDARNPFTPPSAVSTADGRDYPASYKGHDFLASLCLSIGCYLVVAVIYFLASSYTNISSFGILTLLFVEFCLLLPMVIVASVVLTLIGRFVSADAGPPFGILTPLAFVFAAAVALIVSSQFTLHDGSAIEQIASMVTNTCLGLAMVVYGMCFDGLTWLRRKKWKSSVQVDGTVLHPEP